MDIMVVIKRGNGKSSIHAMENHGKSSINGGISIATLSEDIYLKYLKIIIVTSLKM
jgi:hypothetical protein